MYPRLSPNTAPYVKGECAAWAGVAGGKPLPLQMAMVTRLTHCPLGRYEEGDTVNNLGIPS